VAAAARTMPRHTQQHGALSAVVARMDAMCGGMLSLHARPPSGLCADPARALEDPRTRGFLLGFLYGRGTRGARRGSRLAAELAQWFADEARADERGALRRCVMRLLRGEEPATVTTAAPATAALTAGAAPAADASAVAIAAATAAAATTAAARGPDIVATAAVAAVDEQEPRTDPFDDDEEFANEVNADAYARAIAAAPPPPPPRAMASSPPPRSRRTRRRHRAAAAAVTAAAVVAVSADGAGGGAAVAVDGGDSDRPRKRAARAVSIDAVDVLALRLDALSGGQLLAYAYARGRDPDRVFRALDDAQTRGFLLGFAWSSRRRRGAVPHSADLAAWLSDDAYAAERAHLRNYANDLLQSQPAEDAAVHGGDDGDDDVQDARADDCSAD